MALPYPTKVVLPFDIATAQDMNERHANDVALANGAGLDDGAVKADKIDWVTLKTDSTSLLYDTGWVNITLNAGFTGSPQIRRVGSFVFTRGLITRTAGPFPTSYQTIATIPAGFRTAYVLRFTHSTYPSGAASTYMVSYNTDGTVTVASNGAVQGDQIYLNNTWLLDV